MTGMSLWIIVGLATLLGGWISVHNAKMDQSRDLNVAWRQARADSMAAHPSGKAWIG